MLIVLKKKKKQRNKKKKKPQKENLFTATEFCFNLKFGTLHI